MKRHKRMDGRLWRLLSNMIGGYEEKGLPPGCGPKTVQRALDNGLIRRFQKPGWPQVYWQITDEGSELVELESNRGRQIPRTWGSNR